MENTTDTDTDTQIAHVKSRIPYIIMTAIGIAVVVIGIMLLFGGVSTNLPEELELGDEGWFESAKARNSAEFKKTALIGSGAFVIFTGVALLISGLVGVFKKPSEYENYEGNTKVTIDAVDYGTGIVSAPNEEAELSKIESMKKKGLINEEEYQKMRKKILGLPLE